MHISCFRNFKSKKPENSTLEAMAQYIRTDRSLAQITALYRQGGSKTIKEGSPMFAVAATFSGGKSKEHITALTGLSLVDLDHVAPDRLEAMRRAAAADPHTLLCYTTISGAGLRIIFKYELDGTYSMSKQLKFYNKAFAAGNGYYARLLGTEPDMQCKNVNRLSGLAHDPDVYFCPSATPFTATEIDECSRETAATDSRTRQFERIDSYFRNVIIGRLPEGLEYAPGSHNDYVMRVGYMLAQRRYPESAVTEWAKTMFADYADTEQVIHSCFANANHKDKDDGKALPLASVTDIKAFLDRRIRLRHNVISGRIEFFDADTADGSEQWQPFVDRMLNTLWADMAMDYKVCKFDIDNIVNSIYTPLFNPFTHYLDSLPQWHEGDHDHIADLAATVRLKSTGALNFCEVLRKWLVAMLASWLGSNTVNHVILVLIGEQGVYKTTWFNYLLPPELRRYFYNKVNINRTTRDEMIFLSRYALMCYEELDCMNAADLNRLKGIVTMEHIDEREPYARYAEHRPHIASFCGTGNNLQFLTDPTGNRRWMPFEVESIISPREHPLNYVGIYSQVYALYLSGFRYYFSPEEIKIQNGHNRYFESPNMEMELISLYFRRPNQGETPTFMTSSRALQIIGTGIAQKLSTVRIGKAFTDLGFVPARCSGIRGYWVIERSAEEMRLFQKNVTVDA